MEPNEQVPQEEVVEPEVEEQETEPTQEVEEPENAPEEAEPEEEEVAPQPEEPQPSRRESLRIQQLIQKMKQPEKPVAPQTPVGLDYASELDTTPEVADMLNQDRGQYGQAMYQQGLEQVKSMQFHTRLDIDAPRVESRYPILDPSNKDTFNPAIADALNTAYLNMAGYDSDKGTVQNPDIRYADYIEAQMELAEVIAGDKNAKTVQNIAKQATKTGLRPDGSKAKSMNLNQAPEQMTDEELAAVIAQNLK